MYRKPTLKYNAETKSWYFENYNTNLKQSLNNNSKIFCYSTYLTVPPEYTPHFLANQNYSNGVSQEPFS